ncbi:uncharacterized protein LOC129589563 [Paramacrobiotus metropolitanus]|uniref:uncharacterized protein LOC129589563 n=1 Tax=Paramacrobiotus metropolitanus TaxID=2943436 RepID=UPI0024456A86|nr:uncharacterized protein LOC129589563 [Paramacrobiotus metropolitanus]
MPFALPPIRVLAKQHQTTPAVTEILESYSPISSPSPPSSPVLSPNVFPVVPDSPESPAPENAPTMLFHTQQPLQQYSSGFLGTRHHAIESQLLDLLRLSTRILNGPPEHRLTGVLNLRDLITDYAYIHHRTAAFYHTMPYTTREHYTENASASLHNC